MKSFSRAGLLLLTPLSMNIGINSTKIRSARQVIIESYWCSLLNSEKPAPLHKAFAISKYLDPDKHRDSQDF